MNKYQLYTLGGALLAASSLSGTAFAAASLGNTAGTGSYTAGTVTMSNASISSSSTAADATTIGASASTGAQAFRPTFKFLNQYNAGFNLKVTFTISGATFASTPTAKFLIGNAVSGPGTTAVATVGYSTLNGTTNASSVSKLSNQIILNNVRVSLSATVIATDQTFDSGSTASANVQGVILDGLTFTTAGALRTAGGTITLGATVADTSTTYETLAATAIVTSAAPLTTTVTAGSAATVAVGSGATLFSTLSGSTGNSVTLATILITSNGTLGTDLSVAVDADGTAATGNAAGSSAVSITVTSATLSDTSASTLKLRAPSTTLLATKSIFSAGSNTFTLRVGTANLGTYTGTSSIVLGYNGSTTISQAAAGTVSVDFSANTVSLQAPASASGTTAAVNVGGLSSQVNWANAGTGSGFTSYVRIHNSASTAARATIVVKKDTTDGTAVTTVGTYTTDTIAGGGTIQVPVAGTTSIESTLGVNSATAGGSYTLLITGPFPGYIQHLSYNGSSLFDLSGFRNGAATDGSAP